MKSSKPLLDVIRQDATETCMTLGLVFKKSREPDSSEFTHVPISIAPTPFPKEAFEQALEVQ